MIVSLKEHAVARAAGLLRLPGTPAMLGPAMLCLALAGCASPGFPRAPSLHLAEPVADLTATRIADRVELHWTAPTRTTDGLDLAIPTTVEVCRDVFGPSPATSPAQPPCTVVLKVASQVGPSVAIDRLPASLTNAQASRQLLAYRVRVLNPSGRAATPNAMAVVPAGPSPAPVEAFGAVQKKDGVLLSWREDLQGSGGMVEVLRTELSPKPAAAGPRSGVPATGAPKAPNPIAARRKTDPSAEVRLKPDAALPQTTPDPGGMIDQSTLPDGIYSYRAQRSQAVHADGKTFEVLSESTVPIIVAMRDTFPPNAPTGLVSVPGTIAPRGSASSQVTIDLSWQPNIEADLSGYHVYRTELSGGAVRLTASPVPGPAFRDTTVLPGHRYVYRVTAVDRNGNESVPSAPIEDSPDGR